MGQAPDIEIGGKRTAPGNLTRADVRTTSHRRLDRACENISRPMRRPEGSPGQILCLASTSRIDPRPERKRSAVPTESPNVPAPNQGSDFSVLGAKRREVHAFASVDNLHAEHVSIELHRCSHAGHP